MRRFFVLRPVERNRRGRATRAEVVRVVRGREAAASLAGDGEMVAEAPIRDHVTGREAGEEGDIVTLSEWGGVREIWTLAHGHRCPCGEPARCAGGALVVCTLIAVCEGHRALLGSLYAEEGAATLAARDCSGVPSLRDGTQYNRSAGGTPAERAYRRLAAEVAPRPR